MAIGTVYAALPAAAAAIGLYLYNRNNMEGTTTRPSLFSNLNPLQEHDGATAASDWVVIEKVKERHRLLPNPKMAPQFDGLNCFETLVGS